MKKVLVTGATGFIGKACLSVLKHTDLEIHATYRNRPISDITNVHWYHCDILNHDNISAVVSEVKPDYLLHLAWIVDHKTCMTSELNIDYIFASIHLYKQFSINGGKKTIFLGTCAEYDSIDSVCDENKTSLKPNSLYGLCKKNTLEIITQLKLQQPEYADFTWARIFHLYGPHEYKNRLIPYIFHSYLQRIVPVLENPHSVRDYIYVQNLAEIVVHLLVVKCSPIIINVGSGNSHTIEELANSIHLRFFKDQAPPSYKPGIITKKDHLVPALNRLQQLKIQPSVSFELGLEKTFKWCKSQYEQHLLLEG